MPPRAPSDPTAALTAAVAAVQTNLTLAEQRIVAVLDATTGGLERLGVQLQALVARVASVEARMQSVAPEALVAANNKLLGEQAMQLELLVKMLVKAREMFADLAADLAPASDPDAAITASVMPQLGSLASQLKGSPGSPGAAPNAKQFEDLLSGLFQRPGS